MLSGTTAGLRGNREPKDFSFRAVRIPCFELIRTITSQTECVEPLRLAQAILG